MNIIRLDFTYHDLFFYVFKSKFHMNCVVINMLDLCSIGRFLFIWTLVSLIDLFLDVQIT
jgi:hypothetical protein